ncbi:MAG: ABC transporter ATP-binding protein [Anaerolineae bacterium]
MTLLRAHDLAIGYPGLTVASGMDLSLAGGEMVCLLGPNGAGKSTLMRTLAGMQKPLNGQVLLAGTDIARRRPREIASRLSVVLTGRPNVGLLNGYALVALGRHPHTGWMGRLSDHDEAVIRWAVEAVGAAHLAEQPVMTLSDGQRQKFMIARALAQESELILLDEPTAYLDLPRRVEIMRLLRHLAEETGRAILLSTHDLDLALRSADSLWLMSDGEVRPGTPEDLILSGAFEAAFRGEGVTFDRATGAFSVEQVGGRRITVYGAGIPHTWTRRALKRAGFTLVGADEVPQACIQITGGEAAPVWHIDQGGDVPSHHSIREVLDALQQGEENQFE